MSLFSKVGETFERTKQAITSDEPSGYVCRACEESTTADYDHCPHCGEPAVEAVDADGE